MYRLKNIFLIFICVLSVNSWAQSLVSGVVVDELETPIPSAKIYVKNFPDKRVVANDEGYFELWLNEGDYYLIATATGYKKTEYFVGVKRKNKPIRIQVFPEAVQTLENVEVVAKKRNLGREYILKVAKKREQISPWRHPHKVDVYIKANEKIDRKKKKNKENTSPQTKTINDPFSNTTVEEADFLRNRNFVEVNIERSFQSKNKIKETRNAFKQSGNKENYLYYTTTVKSNFDFFRNLLHLKDLHHTPVASPISAPGILSYKYRLVKQYEENGRKIHVITITPRLTATTTIEGEIHIYDSLWMIKKLDLTMEKGNLIIYDYFQIQQEYGIVNDSINILEKQQLNYGVKYKAYASTCNTSAVFSNYNFAPQFPPKFFSNELSVTEKEAYEKDTSYWNQSRVVELSAEEEEFIRIRDSLEVAHNKKEYLDSIDKAFNKVTFLKVLWWGVDHRNRAKKTQWTINSLIGMARPIYIAGPRVAPGFFYFKKWENERYIDGYSEVSVGFMNGDLKGRTDWDFRYNPFKFGTISARFDHDFDAIRSYDAITQIFKRDNFIEKTSLEIGHFIEIANGLDLDVNLSFAERRSIEGYKFITKFDKELGNNEPTKFQSYQAMIANAELAYTPGQKYMREPYRKVILGSKWPTFYLYYEKGISDIFGSDVNFDYVSGGIRQTLNIGTIGTSSYHVKTGRFLNQIKLREADQKYHRRSDPIWFSNPMYSFQDLDSTLPTQKMYLELHYVHHGNGAILNKIPFMKKTRIGLVFGAGMLYVPEHNWQHYEAFVGLERTFKLSKRRLRIGIYGVLSDGNHIKTRGQFKVSFSLLNNRDLKWNF